VLTFFAQDARHATLCYSNADIAKADQAHEIIRFCEFWQRTGGQQPRLLVFDSTLTTHAELAELDDRGISFIALRRRGGTLMDQVAKLPDEAWSAVRLPPYTPRWNGKLERFCVTTNTTGGAIVEVKPIGVVLH